MDIYLNDSIESFQFVLKGDLAAGSVRSLEQAWITATSILGGKDVSVEVSGLTAADDAGVELLYRMTASGARLTAALPPESEDLLRSLGIPVAAPARRDHPTLLSSLGRLFGLSF
jgi:ABC-type transporter Mla MlaB component